MECTIDGCTKPQAPGGLCWMHATRKKRHGSPHVPPQRERGVRRHQSKPLRHLLAADVAAKVAYWGDRCWMCGGPWSHLDHVKPRSKGGLDLLANVRPACSACNQMKSDAWPFVTSRRMVVLPADAARRALRKVNVGDFDERRLMVLLRKVAA